MPSLLFAVMILPVVALRPMVAKSQSRAELRDDIPAAVAHLAGAGAASDAAWPGFRPPAEFLLCQGSDLTVLVSDQPLGPEHGGRPADIVSVSGAPPIHVYRGRAQGLPPSCFTFRFPHHGRQILAFPALETAFSIRDPQRALVVGVLHEWFHQYQRSAFAATDGAKPEWRYGVHEATLPMPAEVMEDDAFQRGARDERLLLARALSSPEGDSMRLLIREYLTARAARMRLLPPELRGVEPHEERKEGTAQYAAYRTVFARGAPASQELVSLLQEDLREPLDFAQAAAGSVRTWRSWHIYATGAAIGVLLDRLGCDWRLAVAEGSSFFAVLLAATGDEPSMEDVVTPVPTERRFRCGDRSPSP